MRYGCGRDSFPLAFVVVESENIILRGCFLTKVKNTIGNREDTVVISDKHEGILHGVKEVYPSVTHDYCIRHLLNNIKKNFNELSVYVNWKFINTTKTYRVEEWKSYM